MKIAALFLAALLSLVSSTRAEVKMPALFGDHMVLQQDQKIRIWGWAEPRESITVTLGLRNGRAVADGAGKWQLFLDPLPSNSTPQTLTIRGKNELKIQDVLIGEVWVCSGQSNMEYSLDRAHTAQADLPKATDPQIRLFLIPRTDRAEPQEDVAAKWVVCSPQDVRGFSGVGYYFARDLRSDLRRPVGLIGSYWGGTPAQSWTSVSGLEKEPSQAGAVTQSKNDTAYFLANKDAYPALLATFQEQKAKWDAEVRPAYQTALQAWDAEVQKARAENQPLPPRPAPSQPEPPAPRSPNPGPHNAASLFNGMIAPLTPFSIRGVIWYQGESNADRALEYGTVFPRMILDWREKWGRADLPFLFVQLPNYEKLGPNEDWVTLRESQTKALALPNTGMAVTIDVGNPQDIHPADKLDVALRLARVARHVVYKENFVWSGPIFDAMRIVGSQARLSFKEIGGGLKIGASPWTPAGPATVAAELRGFLIAGSNHQWVEAQARIDGGRAVLVSSPQVPNPVAVRYAWLNNPEANLYNQENLPTAPFRTDNWDKTAGKP